jgi:hypothetical protein
MKNDYLMEGLDIIKEFDRLGELKNIAIYMVTREK